MEPTNHPIEDHLPNLHEFGFQVNFRKFSGIIHSANPFLNLLAYFQAICGVCWMSANQSNIVHALTICFIRKKMKSSPATSPTVEADFPITHFWQDTLIFRDKVNLMQNNVGILGFRTPGQKMHGNDTIVFSFVVSGEKRPNPKDPSITSFCWAWPLI